MRGSRLSSSLILCLAVAACGRNAHAYVAGRIHSGGNVAVLDQPGVARVRDSHKN